MDLDPDMPRDADDPEPAWVDEDAAPRHESLWLARARAAAARSEPHEPSAFTPQDVEPPPRAETAAWTPASAFVDLPAAADGPALTEPLFRERAFTEPVPWAEAAALTEADPRLETAAFTGAPVSHHALAVPETPAIADLAAAGARGSHDEAVECDGAVPPDEAPLDVDLVHEGPAVPTLLPAVVAPPHVPPRPNGRSFGGVAGVAIAAVGGAAIVLTMMVPRHAPTAPAGPAPGPAPVKAAAPAARPASAPIAVEAPRWRATSEWTGGRKKSVAYELQAERPVRLWMRQATPLLVVRCLGGALDAFVVTGSPTAIEPQRTDHTVRLVFDGTKEHVEYWGDSAEHDGLFAPDGRAFFAALSTARTLRVGFTPHNAPAAEASFGLAGVDALAAPLKKHCR